MNYKTITEFGFRIIRIMEISEGVIRRGRDDTQGSELTISNSHYDI